jgi:hypothetical protein
MAELLRYPTDNTVVTTGWTNPANAYAAEGTPAYATAAPAKNATVNNDWHTFDWSTIPAGSTINSVTVEVRWYLGAVITNGITVGAQGYVSGSAVGSELTNAAAAAATTESFTISDLTLADLANLAIRARTTRGSTNTNGTTGYLDFVRVTVDYTVVTAQHESGGSVATVATEAVGAGGASEIVMGGSGAGMEAQAVAAGVGAEVITGGSLATAIVEAFGDGVAEEVTSVTIEIERRVDGGLWGQVHTGDDDGEWIDAGPFVDGSVYEYRARRVEGTTTSAWSNVASVTYAGSGQHETGGSAATVTAGAVGAGTPAETASGGSSIEVTAQATAAGTAAEVVSGGSQAEAVAAAVGAGTGAEVASGGSQANVEATATGGGFSNEQQAESGGSTATVEAQATGAGAAAESASGGSQAEITAQAIGAGSAQETPSGGSMAAVAADATGAGAGAETGSGGSLAAVVVEATGAGVADIDMGDHVAIAYKSISTTDIVETFDVNPWPTVDFKATALVVSFKCGPLKPEFSTTPWGERTFTAPALVTTFTKAD